MNPEVERSFALTRAHSGQCLASIERLIAEASGDPVKIAAAEKTRAGFTNLIAELKLPDKRHNFSRGDAVRLDASTSIATGVVSGWASTGGMDMYRHKITPGAFSKVDR